MYKIRHYKTIEVKDYCSRHFCLLTIDMKTLLFETYDIETGEIVFFQEYEVEYA